MAAEKANVEPVRNLANSIFLNGLANGASQCVSTTLVAVVSGAVGFVGLGSCWVYRRIQKKNALCKLEKESTIDRCNSKDVVEKRRLFFSHFYRLYDILEAAKKNNNYKHYMIDIILNEFQSDVYYLFKEDKTPFYLRLFKNDSRETSFRRIIFYDYKALCKIVNDLECIIERIVSIENMDI